MYNCVPSAYTCTRMLSKRIYSLISNYTLFDAMLVNGVTRVWLVYNGMERDLTLILVAPQGGRVFAEEVLLLLYIDE